MSSKNRNTILFIDKHCIDIRIVNLSSWFGYETKGFNNQKYAENVSKVYICSFNSSHTANIIFEFNMDPFELMYFEIDAECL